MYHAHAFHAKTHANIHSHTAKTQMFLSFARHELASIQISTLDDLVGNRSGFFARLGLFLTPQELFIPYFVLQLCFSFSFSMRVPFIMPSASDSTNAQAPDHAPASSKEIRAEQE